MQKGLDERRDPFNIRYPLLPTLRCRVVSQPAARGIGGGGINRGIADIDKRDFALLINNVGDAIGHAVGPQNAVLLQRGAGAEITQQRVAELQLVGEHFQGGNIVGANAEHLGLVAIELCDTSLVRCHFLRSATGEGGGEESKYHWVLAS